ncbi:hypothetical protein IFM89_038936 [Coptis chinensis]|uniref:Cytochrome P450 n=1 Tax=Coptis chinensis TaxID=261450 RepID=A0A835I9B2_9MAGN|nr:hypothetical protein IFM89_038936 [Coptis chinensis]
MKAINIVLDGFLEKIIDEHVQDAKELHGTHRDFIDVMLSLMESNNARDLHLGRDHIKAITVDMLAATMDTSRQDFRFLPFGSGRRKCPGMQLGSTVVELVLAQLVHCFNLELPNGMSPDDLDMTEKFGLSLPRANHLMAVPTYRLIINV